MTEWFDIPGLEGYYKIRKDGAVLNVGNGNILHGSVNSHGYLVVSMQKDGQRITGKVHRLLAQAFLPNPNDFDCVNHKDGNKLNNSLDNLEWCTKAQNNRHAHEVLHKDYTARPVCQSTLDGEIIAMWANTTIAAKSVNITAPCIANCCEGRAKTAGGYAWSYAGKLFCDFVADNKRQIIQEKISELENQISLLQAQL